MVSNTAARKAGSVIREYHQGEYLIDREEYLTALNAVGEYRRSFYTPMVKVNCGLRSFCKTLGLEATVTQRLKRQSTIIDKLLRLPGTDLSRLQDIAGCRVVLSSIDDVYSLRDHIINKWDVIKEDNYIKQKHASGYRSLHLVVKNSGKRVEIQIRTKIMHEWALLAEEFSDRDMKNYKQDGDSTVQDFLRVVSDIYEYQEINPNLIDTVELRELLGRYSKAKSLLGQEGKDNG